MTPFETLAASFEQRHPDYQVVTLEEERANGIQWRGFRIVRREDQKRMRKFGCSGITCEREMTQSLAGFMHDADGWENED